MTLRLCGHVYERVSRRWLLDYVCVCVNVCELWFCWSNTCCMRVMQASAKYTMQMKFNLWLSFIALTPSTTYTRNPFITLCFERNVFIAAIPRCTICICRSKWIWSKALQVDKENIAMFDNVFCDCVFVFQYMICVVNQIQFMLLRRYPMPSSLHIPHAYIFI